MKHLIPKNLRRDMGTLLFMFLLAASMIVTGVGVIYILKFLERMTFNV